MTPKVLLFGVGAQVHPITPSSILTLIDASRKLSIGSIYAAILSFSGECEAHLVARSNCELLKENGLKLTSEKFGDHESIRFAGVYRTCDEAAKTGITFDYVLVSTKALLDASPSLSEQIGPIMKKNTSVVLLQNGVGAEEPLHKAFPGNTIISAVVWTGGRILSPNHIEQFNREALTIGVDWTPAIPREVEQARLDGIVGLLRKGGGECSVTEDVQSERWVKVVWNACWNAVTTATLLRTSHFLSTSPHAMTLSRTIMTEVIAVATAKGLNIPDGTVDKLIEQCVSVKAEGGLGSSMMMDCLGGRGMEVEVILGTPLREGLRLGVPVPSLTAMYTIIKALDWKNAHPAAAKY